MCEIYHTRLLLKNYTIYLENTALSDKFESIAFLLEFFLRGVSGDKKGTAFVIYEDIFDAKNAFDHLSGFNVAGR
jgi:pre-mRNA branch site protein p14